VSDDRPGQVPSGPASGRGDGRRAARILWLIAAALAFTAWTIDYLKDHHVRYTSLALGVFCLVMVGTTVWRRR
jgi:hypothetical protein